MTDTTATHRLDRIRAQLEPTGARALLLAAGEDVRYAVGYTPPGDERVSFLVVGATGAALVVPGVNATDVRLRLGHLPVLDYADDEGPQRRLHEALELATGSAAGGGTLLLSDKTRHDHVLKVGDALRPDEVSLASRVLRPLRMIKDADELDRLRAASHIADQVFLVGARAVTRGATERDVQAAMLQAFRAAEGDGPSGQLVAYGANTAAPHHQPDDTVLADGPLWLDLGCRKDGYWSDLTRCVYVGTPTDRYREIFAIVDEARQAGQDAVAVGAPASAVDRSARAVIERAGYGPYFVHRTGHGIGLEGHEPPFMMRGDETPLAVGMTFSIEPGIYLPGEFGVRIEDVVAVTRDGAEVLPALSHRWIEVDR